MLALLFLIGSALLGAGLVRLVTGRLLHHAEQGLWGLVLGWAISTIAAYAAARAAGGISFGLIVLLTGLIWVAAFVLWFRSLRRWRFVRPSLHSLWRPEYKGLLFVLLLFAPIYFELFRTHMLQKGMGGLYSGGDSTWFDLSLHLAISNSFLYGQNFPPVYTPFPPEPLLYPFLPDFQTAVLARAGLDLHSALVITGVLMALALTGLFYSLAHRVTQTLLPGKGLLQEHDEGAPEAETFKANGQDFGRRAQKGAVLATALFLLNGGLGFLYFLQDWWQSGKGFFDFWSHLKINYANMWERGIHWVNIIGDGLLPQRTLLYGMPLTLICLTLFAIVWDEWSADSRTGGRWDGWRRLLMAGVVAGVLPLFHVHSYIAVGLVSISLMLLCPRRAWLAFFVPAVLLALPLLIPLVGHAAADIVRLQPGWKGAGESNWLFYWLRNIGLPLLLIFPSYFTAPPGWRRFYLAFVALLLFSLLVIVSPNDFDNIKLIYYWYAMTSILIGNWLVRLAHARWTRLLAGILFTISVTSAVLALQYEWRDRKLLFSDEEVTAAVFVRDHTEAHALFLTAPAFNQPILCLAGRPVLRANTDWLWSHGYEFGAREADVKMIYAGGVEALELLRYYGVAYIYLGQKERDDLRANQSFFEMNFPVLFRSDRITIYDTRTMIVGSANSSSSSVGSAPREFASRIGKDPYQLLSQFPRASYCVYRYYRVAFGRMPEYQEMIEDMREVGKGVYVGESGWQQKLEINKTALVDGWTERRDFKALYAEQTNAQYVDALYAHAGVQPTARERADIITALDAQTITRAATLQRVAENSQLYRKEYNPAFVLMQYFGYLRRNPGEPPDGGMAGFNFWLSNLNQTGDYRSLVRAFLESAEYKEQIKKAQAVLPAIGE